MDLTGVRWRKSSYSASNGGNCVEVAQVWRKSSYSGGNGGDCVEVARALPAAVAVRDSKNPDGPKLLFPPAAWTAFTTTIRTGELNRTDALRNARRGVQLGDLSLRDLISEGRR